MAGDPLSSTILLGVAGAAVGSFIGLVSLRLPAGEPVLFGRSRCGGCGRTLGAGELVPLLSYLLQRGRCRRCGSRIAWRYPAIEAAAALVGVVAGTVLAGPAAVAAAVLGWWLLLLAILDAEHFWLPSVLTLPLVVAGLGATWLLDPAGLGDHVAGAVAGFASLAGLAAVYLALRRRTGLGGGDARLFAAAGAWLGWLPLPLVLAVAAIAGLLAAVTIWRRDLTATTRLPFGTFLAAATWLVYLVRPWPY
ncbi:MAG: prepilin peptidase [Janthinobacterium lividum]